MFSVYKFLMKTFFFRRDVSPANQTYIQKQKYHIFGFIVMVQFLSFCLWLDKFKLLENTL